MNNMFIAFLTIIITGDQLFAMEAKAKARASTGEKAAVSEKKSTKKNIQKTVDKDAEKPRAKAKKKAVVEADSSSDDEQSSTQKIEKTAVHLEAKKRVVPKEDTTESKEEKKTAKQAAKKAGQGDSAVDGLTAGFGTMDLNKETEITSEEFEGDTSGQMRFPAVYFSPNIKPVLEKLIAEEEKSIEGACYEFTLYDLAKLWIEKKSSKMNFVSELIVHDILPFFKGKGQYIKFPHPLIWLKLNGIAVSGCEIRNKNIREFGGSGNMHHKFFIFGKNSGTGKSLLITGSFNWTGQADIRNWEDIVILDDPKAIKTYKDYYKDLPREELSVPLLLLYRKREELDQIKNLDKTKKINGFQGTDEARLNALIEKKHPHATKEVDELDRALKSGKP